MQCIKFNPTDHLDRFELFLKSETMDSKDSAAENMWADNWSELPNSLPYILMNTNKFSGQNGEFHLILDEGTIVACGGVQIAHFNSKIALAGIRTWVAKSHRNKLIVAKYLLPAHKAWALEHDCKQIALTFNEYNKNLTRPFTRTRAGEDGTRISKRTQDMMFYNGVTELEYTVTIQYTPQWVIYEKLDPEWIFNWQAIRSK